MTGLAGPLAGLSLLLCCSIAVGFAFDVSWKAGVPLLFLLSGVGIGAGVCVAKSEMVGWSDKAYPNSENLLTILKCTSSMGSCVAYNSQSLIFQISQHPHTVFAVATPLALLSIVPTVLSLILKLKWTFFLPSIVLLICAAAIAILALFHSRIQVRLVGHTSCLIRILLRWTSKTPSLASSCWSVSPSSVGLFWS